MHSLKEFVKEHVTSEWKTLTERHVYSDTNRRFRIIFETNNDFSGLGRDIELSDQGVDAVEIDTREFTSDLVNAISEYVSIYELTYIIAEFQRELEEQETRRLAAQRQFEEKS